MDRVRIRQVILNLLANAARFTDAGSVTLRAACDEKYLTISVIDTGLGIPADKQDRVFEEFYQVERQFSTTKGGTGLGLALSRQFVTLHQGTIWVESEGLPGRGSRFSFTLPLADISSYYADPTFGHAPVEDTQQQVRHVIIWDEDPAIIQLFRGYVRKHPVSEARSLAEAMQLVSTLRPMAVICDENTNTTLLEQHLLTVSPEITLIKCPMPSSKRVIQNLGLADYLVKPISRQALLNALKRLDLPIRTVLVIDDDRDILRMISRFLQTSSADYIVQLASSGLIGLQCMRQDKPDVVITDIMMPDLDGLMLRQQMKTDPALKHIPVIAVSARGMVDTIVPLVQGTIFISKQEGFQPIELVNCVEAVVENLTLISVPE
jgi:CheY-like chemotaxis protein